MFYNDVLIATDNFTITAVPPPTVFEHLTTAGPIPDGCGTPVEKTAFAATDATVLQWISISGHQNGSVVRWEWVQPNGTIYKQFQAPINNTNSNICFWDGMSIAGTDAAGLPGNWQVRVFYNGILLATDNFTIGTGGPAADCGKPIAVLAAPNASGEMIVFPNALASPSPPQQLVTGLPQFGNPQGLSFFGSDHVLAGSLSQRAVYVVKVSTASVIDTISLPSSESFGSGTVAVTPDMTAALTSGNTNQFATSSPLHVIRGPFNASSTIDQVTLPGSIYTASTQAIVFNSSGRAFVRHSTGISVLDPPYNSVAFTVPVAGVDGDGQR